ncbi:class I SAM-dependent methyltransferase [bacterium]|nr:class I SAM-dependent methyltransferase [bacterium]
MPFEHLRISCEQRKIPLISRETQEFLSQLLIEKKPHNILEIGSAVGYSTIWIAQIVSQRGGHISSFEISYPAYLEALKNLQKNQVRNAVIYPFDFKEIKLENFFSENFDFVFIDAQKSEYGRYMEEIQGVLKTENTIILDDVIKYQNKLSSLYSFLAKNQVNYEILAMEE